MTSMKKVLAHVGGHCPPWFRAALDLPWVLVVDGAAGADVTFIFPGEEDEPRSSIVVIWCSAQPCPPNPRWVQGPRSETEAPQLVGLLQLASELVGSQRSHHRVLESLASRQRELGVLASVARRLSGGYHSDELSAHVLQEALRVTGSEAGSLALVIDRHGRKYINFAFAENEQVKVPFVASSLPLDMKSLVGYVAVTGETLHILDAYRIPSDAPYRFNDEFDRRNNYRTVSLLVVPLLDRNRKTIAVLQLINKVRDASTTNKFAPQPFTHRDRELAEFLAAIATPVLESNRLYQQVEQIFDGLIQASIAAIETRDPSTSGHSVRVATGAVALAKAVDEISEGPYAKQRFNANEMRELRVTGLLHDFGKIGVPEHILTKAEKLYPWNWNLLCARYDTIRMAWQRRAAEALLAGDNAQAEECARQAAEIPSLLGKLEAAKRPNLLDASASAFLDDLLKRSVSDPDLGAIAYLTPQEYASLTIARGSLTEQEREIIENHVNLTHRFLGRIPWSGNLERVAEYAHGHHEKLNGSGYPRRLGAEHIPVQSRILAIVDFFDALAAWDRPYKPAVPVDQTLQILKQEAEANHFDAELVRIFIEKECYRGMMAIIAKGIEKRDATARRNSSQILIRQIDSMR
jgi:HD-GYP domain-containing protein (c-di-GMP phosphodiesterase class II)